MKIIEENNQCGAHQHQRGWQMVSQWRNGMARIAWHGAAWRRRRLGG